MTMIKQSIEIKAFKCPICNNLIEISDNSKEYITIHGNLLLGENLVLIENGTKICTSCLISFISKISNKPYDIFRDNTKIRKFENIEQILKK